MLVCDSGYASEENIVYITKNDIRSLIMPKITAIYINNKMRSYDEKLETLSGEITIADEEIEKTYKKDMQRIWNGYLCKFNRPVLLTEKTPIPDEKEKEIKNHIEEKDKKIKELINNKMRSYDEKLETLSGEITIADEEIEKTYKKDMQRIWNGYLCKFNRPVLLTEKTPIPDEKEKGLPRIATKMNFKYEAVDCSGCPYIEICKHRSFTEKISPYIFDSMNKFTQTFYQDLYMKRFHKSESVNGYFKGIDGILHLLGTNDNAIKIVKDM